ncbi:acyl carrier protein [Streptacidiphilus anmyonensis]|uniref:acyl carrier protein n=1 Tax=Streptacidiphilus anmyonensis TaxID=405782 RepID=UPI0005AB0D94|nr:acyl carrier protein [Streptacidiphilus anmyonensis]
MNGPVTYDELATVMKGRAGLDVDPAALAAQPDAEFARFDLDSLGLLGVVSELEQRYGRAIGGLPETCRTPRTFLAAVNGQLGTGA